MVDRFPEVSADGPDCVRTLQWPTAAQSETLIMLQGSERGGGIIKVCIITWVGCYIFKTIVTGWGYFRDWRGYEQVAGWFSKLPSVMLSGDKIHWKFKQLKNENQMIPAALKNLKSDLFVLMPFLSQRKKCNLFFGENVFFYQAINFTPSPC